MKRIISLLQSKRLFPSSFSIFVIESKCLRIIKEGYVLSSIEIASM